jgi:hypothetical protein
MQEYGVNGKISRLTDNPLSISSLDRVILAVSTSRENGEIPEPLISPVFLIVLLNKNRNLSNRSIKSNYAQKTLRSSIIPFSPYIGILPLSA